jgi:hypothetical protein
MLVAPQETEKQDKGIRHTEKSLEIMEEYNNKSHLDTLRRRVEP